VQLWIIKDQSIFIFCQSSCGFLENNSSSFFFLIPIPSQLSHLNGHQKQKSKAKLRIRCGVTICSSFFVNEISILNFNYCLIVINFNNNKKYIKSILYYQLNFIYTQKLKVKFLNSNHYLKGSSYIQSIIVSW
jgi:hypothetical protein